MSVSDEASSSGLHTAAEVFSLCPYMVPATVETGRGRSGISSSCYENIPVLSG